MRDGIESELIKISDTRGGGCTHGVRINGTDFFRVVGIMREKGIDYSVVEEK
jgi:vacuolar-type H+-ATPase subunit E/Vma4